MKVKYIGTTGRLKQGQTYSVFSICDWKIGERKYYISDYDKEKYHISPFDIEEFEIIDGKISEKWEYGVDNFGNICVGIPELHNVPYFWDKYFNDDSEVLDIINSYFINMKEELFNIPQLSEKEIKKRKDSGWEYIGD